MCTYLDQVGSTYYFRRVVPQELRHVILTRTGKPRSEWKISLGTKDRQEAKRLIPSHTIETDRLLDEARRALASSGVGAVSHTMTDAEYARFEYGLEGAEIAYRETVEKEERQSSRADILSRWKRVMKKSTAQMTPEEAAVHDLLQEERELTRQQSIQAEKALQLAAVRRGQPMPALPKTSAVPLLATFDSYAAEQGIKPGTAKEWRGAISALISFLGHDDAARLSAADLMRWRDELLAGTTKRGTKREPRTVKNGYFTPVKAALNWAVENHKLPENVAAKVVIRIPRKAKLRDRDFTTTEAQTILRATLAAPATNIGERMALARRWIPWLCAYTGARVNEISQLRGQDVTQIDGIWSIRITPEAGTVKANAARTVPLHPHLIEQGFPAVATSAGDGPIFYDPSKTRRPGDGNRHFKKVGERLAEWVREDLQITDPAIQPNHAWRHTFKTMTRAAEIAERVADAIQGHAPKSVGQSYGSVPLKTLADAIGKLPRFETEQGPEKSSGEAA